MTHFPTSMDSLDQLPSRATTHSLRSVQGSAVLMKRPAAPGRSTTPLPGRWLRHLHLNVKRSASSAGVKDATGLKYFLTDHASTGSA
jgi:hypothetical protein